MVGSVDETPTPLRPGCSIFRRRCAYAYDGPPTSGRSMCRREETDAMQRSFDAGARNTFGAIGGTSWGAPG